MPACTELQPQGACQACLNELAGLELEGCSAVVQTVYNVKPRLMTKYAQFTACLRIAKLTAPCAEFMLRLVEKRE
jgi:hypothetical protein